MALACAFLRGWKQRLNAALCLQLRLIAIFSDCIWPVLVSSVLTAVHCRLVDTEMSSQVDKLACLMG